MQERHDGVVAGEEGLSGGTVNVRISQSNRRPSYRVSGPPAAGREHIINMMRACVVLALRVAVLVIQHEDFVMGSYSGSFGKFAKERLLKR